jgi:hypothetical protein
MLLTCKLKLYVRYCYYYYFSYQVTKILLRENSPTPILPLTDRQIPIRIVSWDLIPIRVVSGMAGVMFNQAIDDQRNHPDTMRQRRERMELATATKEGEKAAKQLTSGTAFFNDKVGLNNNDVWEHQ